MIKITIRINGNTTEYPIASGTTAQTLLARQDIRDLFQIPDRVEPVVNGALGAGHLQLKEGDVLSFQTVASDKAAARKAPASTATTAPQKAQKPAIKGKKAVASK